MLEKKGKKDSATKTCATTYTRDRNKCRWNKICGTINVKHARFFGLFARRVNSLHRTAVQFFFFFFFFHLFHLVFEEADPVFQEKRISTTYKNILKEKLKI